MLVPLLGFERIVAPEVVSGIGHLDLDGQKFLEKGSLAIEVCLIRAKRDIQRSAQEASFLLLNYLGQCSLKMVL